MKHIKNGENTVVILSEKEIQIIAAALNNRMCYLQRQKKGPDKRWAEIEWNKCLDLQIEWFKIE